MARKSTSTAIAEMHGCLKSLFEDRRFAGASFMVHVAVDFIMN